MIKSILFITFGCVYGNLSNAQPQTKNDVVELTGIVINADSLTPISQVSVTFSGSNNGTSTKENGCFRIEVLKGDTVYFSHVSYTTQYIVIPKNLQESELTVIQKLILASSVLPVVKVSLMSPSQFARDFVNHTMSDSSYETAQNNTSTLKRRALMFSTPTDGQETTKMRFESIAIQSIHQRQIPPFRYLDAYTWFKFIQDGKKKQRNK